MFSQGVQRAILCMLRDKEFRERASVMPHYEIKVAESDNLCFPDCGFLPGQFFGNLVAPFFYLSTRVFFSI